MKVSTYYKKYKIFFIIVSLLPVTLAGIQSIMNGNLIEMKYGVIASVGFSLVTLIGYLANKNKEKRHPENFKDQ